MTTIDAIRDSFKAVCLAHKVGLSWLSMWQPPLDESAECADTFPAVWWGPLSGSLESPGPGLALQDAYTIDCLFVDQTDTDRSQDERDSAHSRMDAIARQCWRRWADTYVDAETPWQGVTLDIQQTPIPTFQPVYDDAPKMLTGVRMTVTLQAVSVETCMDEYFNA